MPRISKARMRSVKKETPTTQNHQDIFAGLNDVQRAVVDHDSGNAAMYAVAGAGKTRSVVHRIANLVRKGHDPEKILATTFTKKAAGEMNERLAKLGVSIRRRKGDGGARVGTFHSVCWEIVRDGSPQEHYELDDRDKMRYKLKDIVGWRGMRWGGVDITEVFGFISRCKNDLVGPNDAESYLKEEMKKAGGFPDLRFVEAYFQYEDERHRAGLLTFDDMLKGAVEHLQQDRDALLRWQGRYEHVVVDEFQDSNKAQYELMRLLSEQSKSLLVVGDDDQLIYSFRGSRGEYTLTFEDVFKAEGFRAEANYRSRPEILEVANAVIKRNDPDRIKKTNKAQRQAGGEGTVAWVPCEDMDAEAEVVVQRMKELRQQVGIDEFKWSDMAILFRCNAQSRAFEEALLREKIPHVVVNGTDFYSRKEIADVLAYLRLAVDENDDEACERAINRPFRYIGRISIDKLKDIARRSGISLMQAVRNCPDNVGLQHRQIDSLQKFATIIDWVRDEMNNDDPFNGDGELPTVSFLISQIIRRTGYEQWLLADEGSDTAENSRVSNLRELVRTAGRFKDPVELLAHVQRVRNARKQAKKGTVDAVLLMTIHGSKGLEWPAVFVAGASDKLLPHARTTDEREETRLLYVAITRAKDRLMITSPLTVLTGGGVQTLAPCPFLKGILF